MEDVATRLFGIIDSRAWERLPELFHAQVVYERPGYPPFSGLARLERFYREERVIISGTHHIHAAVESARHAACWGTFRGRHRDGSPIEEDFADVYEIEEGRIRCRKSFFFRPAV